MRHKILLPTDFSKNSMKAINYARELYKNDHCIFYVLNVFSATGNILESLLNMEPGSELYETAKLNSENGLAKVFDMITMSDTHNPKHHFEVISQFNNVIEAIKNIVDKKDIEMIVMGTKGETHSRKSAFGSTAIYVMEKVRNCPVLVVPQNAKIKLPKEIVFPTDFKINFKRKELNYLTDIAKKCNATIVILHIAEQDELDKNQKENKQLLEEILQNTNYKFHNLSHTSVTTAVNLFVESRESDMVAFINKKHAFFGSVLSNPMVKEISFHLNVPILTMHDLKN
ncbi:universal stress protein [uncultured Winogradskyella sp.]|uniref:universal stress protein n=1 Tax=uncultured Winogradskyella sp. TaxID=395353 RepID=UPI0026205259|nr:universal stress protein [uncultured Winogradskyella sp.]